jgi:tetratricopeptide (TPR) repeat protein
MPDLKPLSREAVSRALEKAERYRLLKEPEQAESICQDVLLVEPENQKALIILLLALTDQFLGMARSPEEARELLPRLSGEYEKAYYAGIICERRARAILAKRGPGSGFMAHDFFQQALEWYGKAETLRPAGNDDALLRWNTCVRVLERHHELQPAHEERTELSLE